jgi:hypothetical protein
MSEMREWLLAGLMTACVGSLVGCASPQPPQVMNGFYVEKPLPPRHQHNQPPQIDTVSQPAVPAAVEVQELPAPPPAGPSAEAQSLPSRPWYANDPLEYIEPPPR